MAIPTNKAASDFTFKHTGQVDEYGTARGSHTLIQGDFDSRAIDVMTWLNELQTWLASGGAGGTLGATELTNFGSSTLTVQAQMQSLDDQVKLNDDDIGTLSSVVSGHTTAINLNTAKVSFPEAPINGNIYGRKDAGWSIITGTGSGNVISIVIPVDNAVPRYDGVTGTIIQDSPMIIDDDGNVTGINNLTMSGSLTGANNLVQKSISELEYYVNGATGSDSNDGSVGTPFETIQHALDMLPKYLDYLHPHIIKIDTGSSYAEDVFVENFSCGILSIEPVGAGTFEVTSIRFFNCNSTVYVDNVQVNKEYAFRIENSHVEARGCVVDAVSKGSSSGFSVDAFSVATFLDCTANNCYYGILCAGIAYVGDQFDGFKGTDLTVAYGAGNGGVIIIEKDETTTPTNVYSVIQGGKIRGVTEVTYNDLIVSGDLDVTGDVTANNLSGTNTGDQTSIVGISGTTAEFNTALSDADFVTSYNLDGGRSDSIYGGTSPIDGGNSASF